MIDQKNKGFRMNVKKLLILASLLSCNAFATSDYCNYLVEQAKDNGKGIDIDKKDSPPQKRINMASTVRWVILSLQKELDENNKNSALTDYEKVYFKKTSKKYKSGRLGAEEKDALLSIFEKIFKNVINSKGIQTWMDCDYQFTTVKAVSNEDYKSFICINERDLYNDLKTNVPTSGLNVLIEKSWDEPKIEITVYDSFPFTFSIGLEDLVNEAPSREYLLKKLFGFKATSYRERVNKELKSKGCPQI